MWLDCSGEATVRIDERIHPTVDGSVRHYRQALLRRLYSNADGKPAKKILANLSVASSSVEILQVEWDGAGPVGGPFALLPGRVVQ